MMLERVSASVSTELMYSAAFTPSARSCAPSSATWPSSGCGRARPGDDTSLRYMVSNRTPATWVRISGLGACGPRGRRRSSDRIDAADVADGHRDPCSS